jgi:hypothetical protein
MQGIPEEPVKQLAGGIDDGWAVEPRFAARGSLLAVAEPID